MENENMNDATCESCGRVFLATTKRYYCSHCNKYYYVCTSCADEHAKCRFCSIPLKRKSEPQMIASAKRRSLQRA